MSGSMQPMVKRPWLPFARYLDFALTLPPWYGWCWARVETREAVIAPVGLHILYGFGRTVWLLWLRGFAVLNERLSVAKGRRKA